MIHFGEYLFRWPSDKSCVLFRGIYPQTFVSKEIITEIIKEIVQIETFSTRLFGENLRRRTARDHVTRF